jgi:hypothetical protein
VSGLHLLNKKRKRSEFLSKRIREILTQNRELDASIEKEKVLLFT